MNEQKKNDWEQIVPQKKQSKQYDLDAIYEHAHSELSLQQSKRDQIITIYLALCSFLIPFALGEEIISFTLKGLIFLVVGVVGALFSLITIRYREYKEAYWLCCRCITTLKNFKTEEIDKVVIQSTFYHCLEKNGKNFLQTNGQKVKLKKGKFVKKNLYSAETLHFMIIALMASFIMGLGVALLCGFSLCVNILIGVAVGLCLFLLLLRIYFKTCLKIYSVLEQSGDGKDAEIRDRAFNKVFAKAWFLHFYYENDPLNEEKTEEF